MAFWSLKLIFNTSVSYYEQGGGTWIPLYRALIFMQVDLVGAPTLLRTILMSCNWTLWHGKPWLQWSITATSDEEDPWMFLKKTSVIFTWEGVCMHVAIEWIFALAYIYTDIQIFRKCCWSWMRNPFWVFKTLLWYVGLLDHTICWKWIV